MTWVKLDDRITEHPKVIQAGPLAFVLHIAAMAYAARNLTDGFVPRRAIPTLCNFGGIGELAEVDSTVWDRYDQVIDYELADRLVDAGLWEPHPDGYVIHDYLEYNPSRAQVLDERAKGAARVAQWRNKNKPSGRVSNAVSNAVGNAVTNGHVTPSPDPVPDPVLRDARQERDNGRKTSGARAREAATGSRKVSSHPQDDERIAQVDQGIRARGAVIHMTDDDRAAITASSAPAETIAAAFACAFHGKWGDQWLRDHLTLPVVCKRLAGFEAWQRAGPSAKNGQSAHGNLTIDEQRQKYKAEFDDLEDRGAAFLERQKAKRNGHKPGDGEGAGGDDAGS